jgi:hypothetical protein
MPEEISKLQELVDDENEEQAPELVAEKSSASVVC